MRQPLLALCLIRRILPADMHPNTSPEVWSTPPCGRLLRGVRYSEYPSLLLTLPKVMVSATQLLLSNCSGPKLNTVLDEGFGMHGMRRCHSRNSHVSYPDLFPTKNWSEWLQAALDTVCSRAILHSSIHDETLLCTSCDLFLPCSHHAKST
jgi:hypothetical protein